MWRTTSLFSPVLQTQIVNWRREIDCLMRDLDNITLPLIQCNPLTCYVRGLRAPRGPGFSNSVAILTIYWLLVHLRIIGLITWQPGHTNWMIGLQMNSYNGDRHICRTWLPNLLMEKLRELRMRLFMRSPKTCRDVRCVIVSQSLTIVLPELNQSLLQMCNIGRHIMQLL